MQEHDETTTQTETSPPADKFMDIQSPGDQNQSEGSETSEEPISVPVTSTPDPVSPEDVALSSEDQTVAEAPVEPAATNIQVSDGDAKATDTLAPEHASSETPGSADSHHATPEHSHTPHLVAVLVAIVITIGLSGAVIATFIKSKNDSKLGGDTSSTNSQTTVAKPLASPADVDQTTSDIDKSLNSVDDATDFAATDISDESLGL
jgi:hypothetical protein